MRSVDGQDFVPVFGVFKESSPGLVFGGNSRYGAHDDETESRTSQGHIETLMFAKETNAGAVVTAAHAG